ncbi:hypothetical protein L2E82_18505 [Cichorium intybus]|uniref:Uncharacterized protein n=1 Tax=Cichorium intybus TaxID=13427 RepID=A0ACB9FAZ9_CICIN|nr:hypothetical protein L2E82_18505 [Cichorium intybus]
MVGCRRRKNEQRWRRSRRRRPRVTPMRRRGATEGIDQELQFNSQDEQGTNEVYAQITLLPEIRGSDPRSAEYFAYSHNKVLTA